MKTSLRRRRRSLFLEPLEHRLNMATLTVDSSGDGIAGDGDLTLREAIVLVNAQGNANAALGRGLTAGETERVNTSEPFGVNDTIQFTGDLSAITLVDSRLRISRSVAIEGPGANALTLNAAADRQHLFIDGQSNAIVVQLYGMTFSAGRASDDGAPFLFPGVHSGHNGGAIFSYGATVVVDGVNFESNSAFVDGGAVYSYRGNFTLRNSTLIDNQSSRGGAIFNYGGDLTLVNSVLSENSATRGGGVYNDYGPDGNLLSVQNSTLSNNEASQSGGGIYNRSLLTVLNSTLSGNLTSENGGGIFSEFGAEPFPIEVYNSTFSGNLALGYGGGIHTTYDVKLYYNTFVGNQANAAAVAEGNFGGGISMFGYGVGQSAELYGNILVDNRSGNFGSELGDTPIQPDSSGNLLGFPLTGGFPTGLDNLIGYTAAEVLNPVLADNGGPTLTHALRLDSPARNTGNNSTLHASQTTDQRGLARIADGAVDRGAVEIHVPTGPLLVDLATDEFDGNFGPGDLSLREAIFFANDRAGGDTIRFAPHVSSIALTQGQLTFTDTARTTVEGRVTVSGNNSSRVFYVDSGAFVSLTGLTVTGGSSTAGGGIVNLGNLTLTNAEVSGNVSTGAAGGISNVGTLQLTNSLVANNTAATIGGGILSSAAGPVTLINSTVSGNTAGSSGGGGVYHGGDLTSINSTFVNNRATSGTGGGIYSAGLATLKNSIVVGNVGAGNAARDLAGTPVHGSSTYNLIGDAATAGGLTNSNGNQVGVAAATVLDSTLADNGGQTRTLALRLGSPAINAGLNAHYPGGGAGSFDQRGFPRLAGGTIDLGAVESNFLAGPYTVDTAIDEDDGDFSAGDFSLREAIRLANELPTADLIHITAGLDPIALSLGELKLTDSAATTINGGGVIVSGNFASRIFNVGLGAAASLNNLTVSDGFAAEGGGIANRGTLSIAQSTFRNNAATGGHGGGIHSRGPLTIVNSTFASNSTVQNGGAINHEQGALEIVHATIADNIADADANGSGSGGGIFTQSPATATLKNTIVIGNVVATGVSAFTDSKSRKPQGGTVSRFSAGNPSDAAGVNFTAASSFNMIGHAATAGGLTNNVNGNKVGFAPAAVLAEPLANNGGPTLTYALATDSPAIDAGDNANASGLITDQRGAGFPRLAGGTVDIGAIESPPVQEATSFIVTTNSDVVDAFDQLTSLREAVAYANATAGANTITFAAALDSGSITLSQRLLLTESVTINGPANRITLDGNNATRLLRVNSGVTATLSNVVLTRGIDDTDFVGPVFNAGSLTLDNVRVVNNTSRGAIYSNFGSTLVVQRSQFSGNANSSGAAAILSDSAALTVIETTFSNNAGAGSGAIHSGGVSNISGSTFNGNTAGQNGGAVFHRIGALTIVNSTFSGNSAAGHGGAIASEDGALSVINSTFTQNRADSDNNATGSGGAYHLLSAGTATAVFRNSVLAGNFVGGGTVAGDFGGRNLTAGSYNLIGDAASAGGLTNGVNGNQVGVAVANVLNPNLAYNGGPTQTHALTADSLALDAGADDLVPSGVYFDQRGPGFARIQGFGVDLGAVETPDTTEPVVFSIAILDANPTLAASVRYLVTFSERVIGVLEANDFTLVTNGLTGASIASVATSDNFSFTFTINRGTGTGTLQLKLVDRDSIEDFARNPLGGTGDGNGSFDGPVYTISSNQPPTNVSLGSTQVRENSPAAVVGLINVTDPDANETYTFTVSDSRFEVVNGQLRLKSGVSLPYSNQPIQLTITATDSGGLSTPPVPFSIIVRLGSEATPWHNGGGERSNVDRTDGVDPGDILWTVYYYELYNGGPLPPAPADNSYPLVDVFADNVIDSQDILFAIFDYLAASGGEGEAVAAPSAASSAAELHDAALIWLLIADESASRRKEREAELKN